MDDLLALIRRFEGLRLTAYLCPAGVPTIGYGHTGPDVALDMPPITVEQAEALLTGDAGASLAAALRASPSLRLASAPRQGAVADFIYNLGLTRYKGSTLRRCVDAGDWPAATGELAKWVWGGGRRLPGLVARRAAEAQLLA